MADGQDATSTGGTGTTAKLGKQQRLQHDQLAEVVDSALNHLPSRLGRLSRAIDNLERDREVADIPGAEKAVETQETFVEQAVDAAIELDRLAPGYRPQARAALEAHRDTLDGLFDRMTRCCNQARRTAEERDCQVRLAQKQAAAQ